MTQADAIVESETGGRSPARIDRQTTSHERPQRTSVSVLATGGTIASSGDSRVSFTDYGRPGFDISALIRFLHPELVDIADVSTVQLEACGSSELTIMKYLRVSLAVDEALKLSDAVVVTSGSDTLEELAYWLDLTVQCPKPVIVTGSMRPWAMHPQGSTDDIDGNTLVLGTDGPANLFNAIKVAASQVTYRFGTVVLLNDTFHAARDVTKTNSHRTDTFESPTAGPLGYIDGNHITVPRAPARVLQFEDSAWRTPFDLSIIENSQELPRTEIALAYIDAGGEAITAFAAGGAKGIVIDGMGPGNLSAAMTLAVADARRDTDVWFVNTTRTGSGSTYREGDGVISAGNLTSVKARMLLLLSLAFTADIEQARAWFATYGAPSFARVGTPVLPG